MFFLRASFLRAAEVLLFAFIIAFAIDCRAQNLKVEDIIAKHLDSIGKTEARQPARSRLIVGDTLVKFISQRNASLPGRVVFASAGEKSFFGMRFNSTDYPSEKFSFDGAKVKVGYVRLGVRSMLGNFVISNAGIIEEGLLGGTLSSSWSLLDLKNRKSRLSLSGTKKVNGKDAYVLSYTPGKTVDVDVKLYFDKQTFEHVRTEYKRVSSAGIGTDPSQSSQFNETRINLIENFSNFKTENGINLPHNYQLLYSISGQNGTNEIEWTFVLNGFAFDQNLAANTFDAETN